MSFLSFLSFYTNGHTQLACLAIQEYANADLQYMEEQF